MYPEGYLKGIELFNEGHFWHAHEQWEACWLESKEPAYTFYKGIIQAAGALYQWKRKHNLRGLHRNWYKSRAKLEHLPLTYMGIDIPRFVDAMNAFVVQQQQGGLDVDAPFPRLELV
jgi:hypothetical protein